MIESGMDPDAKLFNMFFTKADASILSPGGGGAASARKVAGLRDRTRSGFSPALSSAVTVRQDTLADFVFGLAIANDLSARDVQLPQTQFFKGKSYRGFGPIGPWLTVLEKEEFANRLRADAP